MDTRIIAKCARGHTFESALRDDRLLRWPEDLSTTFYVSHSSWGGDDSNDGLTPDTALETLTAAIAKCTNYRHDKIYILSWSANEDCPVVVDKWSVAIMGARGGSLAMPGTLIDADGDTEVFSIEAGDVELWDLWLTGGATSACVVFSGSTGANVRQGIYRCGFGVWTACKYGIQGSGGSAGPGHFFTVKDCYFGEVITDGGIYLTSNGSWALFEGNFFDKSPGQGMFISNQNAGRILNNRFACRADAIGAAITMSGTAQRFIIDGNRANFGDTEMSNNPFLDQASQAANHWLLNYKGITATMPQL